MKSHHLIAWCVPRKVQVREFGEPRWIALGYEMIPVARIVA